MSKAAPSTRRRASNMNTKQTLSAPGGGVPPDVLEIMSLIRKIFIERGRKGMVDLAALATREGQHDFARVIRRIANCRNPNWDAVIPPDVWSAAMQEAV